ncbi:hypothetical protein CCACVL1_02737 [Corchorus capsularis]|uniref:Uncharacterized protein n=1 Tax=Corchorus capsularis TaxID=210143 RepID=A0A1R3K6N1_COCAP|nr:hypothetical protein CCACVL1_02737 [Corchorus capsularis]
MVSWPDELFKCREMGDAIVVVGEHSRKKRA